jgi:hypothetical protein
MELCILASGSKWRFRRGNFNGFAGKYDERFWSTEVPESMKSQNSSTKLQTNLKFQYQMTKTGLEV